MAKFYSLIVFMLAAGVHGHAQFTFTAADAPEIGDRFVYYYADTAGVQPGDAGNGRTWNFSNLVAQNDSNVQQFVNPSSTPYASDYPNANQSQTNTDESYNYFQLSGDGYYYHGAVVSDGQNGVVKYKYSDPAKYWPFPYSYGNTYTDNIAASFATSGLNFSRSGTFTGTYDGFGTLVLPTGTFSNVARVKLVEDQTDVASVGGFTVTVKNLITTYVWRQEGRDEALMMLSIIRSESMQGVTWTKVVSFSKASPSGVSVEEFLPGAAIRVFPNPASDLVHIKTDADLKSVSVRTVTGQEVYAKLAHGHEESLDLGHLPRGIYFLVLTAEDGLSYCRKLQLN